MLKGQASVWSAVPVRAWFIALATGSFGLVVAGLILQQMLHLSPCPLCIFQRLLYLLIAVVALAGFALPQALVLWSGLIGSMAAGGFLVAAYQTWLQAFPELARECSMTDPNLIERLVDHLGMQWPGLFMATGFCSSKEWVFLGFSMANWSLLCYTGICVYVYLLLMGRK